jgi:[acyl-carrier-protein] S-malonyltransferase
MLQVALIFPGQGVQKVGMGMELYQSSPEANVIFEEADAIQVGLKEIIFNGPAEKLTSTAYCQPAILTTSVAALKAFEAHSKFKHVVVKFAAGLSLGEYSALVACKALSFADTFNLVQQRSSFMEEATRLQKGKMAAIIGLGRDVITEICKQTGAEVANFNSPEQIVITGHADKVEAACEQLKTAGAKSVIPLDVSGAFHSSLMSPAAKKFAVALKGVKIAPPLFPIVSNVDAVASKDAEHIRTNLASQITSSVQWVNSVNFMAEQGVSDFVEIGPGKVLKGLIRRINSNLRVHNIEKPEDIDALPF